MLSHVPMQNSSPRRSEPSSSDVVRPFRSALLIAVPYAALSVAYILSSSRLAAALARSTEELERIEKFKGIGFILISAAFIFMMALAILRRVERNELALLHSQDALVEAERRALAGTLAACMAHDLNNSLNVIGTGAEVLYASAPPNEQSRALVGHIRKAVGDVTDLAGRLTAVGRSHDRDEFLHVDLAALVREASGLAGAHARLRGCQVVVFGETTVPATVSPRAMQAAILNLLLNAADATDGRGRIEVLVRREGAKHAVIEVSDNGCGLSEAVREHLFSPFYTTKKNGTGLGLLSVKAAVTAHAGQIEALASPLGGACFRIVLPLVPPVSA